MWLIAYDCSNFVVLIINVCTSNLDGILLPIKNFP